jgi:predicted GNAT family N-acyltransferase
MLPLPEGLTIAQATSAEDLAEVHAIRFEVFCDEQQVARDIELEYEDESTHYLARLHGAPVATARWRLTPEGKVKIERCAVRLAYRGRGLGHLVVAAVLDWLPSELRHREVYLHAQVHAERFYHILGFTTVGERFLEAEIEHVRMVWSAQA